MKLNFKQERRLSIRIKDVQVCLRVDSEPSVPVTRKARDLGGDRLTVSRCIGSSPTAQTMVRLLRWWWWPVVMVLVAGEVLMMVWSIVHIPTSRNYSFGNNFNYHISNIKHKF